MAHNPLKSKRISNSPEPRKIYLISRYVPECSRILDLGSGRGLYVPFLLKKAKGVICVDIDRRVCIELYNKGYSVIQADAKMLPFRKFTFDTTFASEVIEHTPSVEETLTEIQRVTSSVIIATLPNPRSPHFKRDPSHIARYSLRSLANFLTSQKDWQYKIRGLGFHSIPAPNLIKLATTFILWFLPWLSPTIFDYRKKVMKIPLPLLKVFKKAFVEHRIFFFILLAGALVKGSVLILSPVTGFENLYFISTKILSKGGVIPYVDYYPAHPPPVVLVGVFLPPITGTRALVFILWLASLIMLYLLSLRYGEKHALLASATLCFLGIVSLITSPFALWEQFTAFFILLALLLLSKGKWGLFGLFLALATSIKIWPVFLLFVLLKRPIAFLKSASVFLLVLIILWTPFIVMSPLMFLSTFAYNFSRGPWQTFWALADGWWGSGGALDFDLIYNTFFSLKECNTDGLFGRG